MAKTSDIKVIGVSQKHIQQRLKRILDKEDTIRNIYHDQHTIILQTDEVQTLAIGTIRPKDAAFLNSLHNPPLNPRVVGGGYQIFNEENKPEKVVADLSELPADQQMLIIRCQWRAQRMLYGLHLEPETKPD